MLTGIRRPFGRRVVEAMRMPFRRLYWYLVMRLSAMCIREWSCRVDVMKLRLPEFRHQALLEHE